MDTSAFEIWVDIYKIVLPIFLAIIAFWLVRFVRSVDRLEAAVSALKEMFAGQSAACKEKHAALNGRIKAIDHLIDEIRKDLTQNHNHNHEN